MQQNNGKFPHNRRDFMNKQHSDAPAARGGMAILCFFAVIAGQAFLLRNILFSGNLSAPFYIELLFCLLMAAGIIICWVRPAGWGKRTGCTIALVLFILYTAFSVLNYNTFASAYLTGISTVYESTGRALVGLKLVLALIGVTAGIPVAPRMDDREYSRRLREKAQMQEAQWAKASARGAQEDLNATLNRLKATLSEEEMAELLAQLQEKASASEKASDTPEASNSVAEEWRGWGGGM